MAAATRVLLFAESLVVAFGATLAWLTARHPVLLAPRGPAPVRRALGVLQQPLLAFALFEGLLILWLIPPVAFRAMIDPHLYAVMNASMLVDGLLFWSIMPICACAWRWSAGWCG